MNFIFQGSQKKHVRVAIFLETPGRFSWYAPHFEAFSISEDLHLVSCIGTHTHPCVNCGLQIAGRARNPAKGEPNSAAKHALARDRPLPAPPSLSESISHLFVSHSRDWSDQLSPRAIAPCLTIQLRARRVFHSRVRPLATLRGIYGVRERRAPSPRRSQLAIKMRARDVSVDA